MPLPVKVCSSSTILPLLLRAAFDSTTFRLFARWTDLVIALCAIFLARRGCLIFEAGGWAGGRGITVAPRPRYPPFPGLREELPGSRLTEGGRYEASLRGLLPDFAFGLRLRWKSAQFFLQTLKTSESILSLSDTIDSFPEQPKLLFD